MAKIITNGDEHVEQGYAALTETARVTKKIRTL